jgi:hypothetical protein
MLLKLRGGTGDFGCLGEATFDPRCDPWTVEGSPSMILMYWSTENLLSSSTTSIDI